MRDVLARLRDDPLAALRGVLLAAPPDHIGHDDYDLHPELRPPTQTAATEAAWAAGAKRVIVDTCSLDHPNAFAHYVARGFKLYDTKVVKREIPAGGA